MRTAPDLTLAQTPQRPVQERPASINEPVEYAIVIRNNGISPINQVRVTDTLPAGFELTGAAPTATAAGGHSWKANIAC